MMGIFHLPLSKSRASRMGRVRWSQFFSSGVVMALRVVLGPVSPGIPVSSGKAVGCRSLSGRRFTRIRKTRNQTKNITLTYRISTGLVVVLMGLAGIAYLLRLEHFATSTRRQLQQLQGGHQNLQRPV
jgi:hypothetical protein